MEANPADLTLGAEEEFLVVDPTGRLSYEGAELADEDDSVEGEFQRELVRCQVETTTPVCVNATDVLDHIVRLRAAAAEQAGNRGLRLVPSATAILPHAGTPAITPGPRYRRMVDWFGDVAHTSNNCGLHVHVGMPDRATGVQVSNRVRAWLPVLLALSANSPFYEGRDTSYQSWRHVLWSRWPTAGPPPVFGSLDHYEGTLDSLARVEAVLDRRMIYWDIRLSEHQPTLEFRVCDITIDPGTAALVAALIRGAVHMALDGADGSTVFPQEVLRANLWRAAREGLPGRCLHPATGDLVAVWQQADDFVEFVRPALRSGGDLDLVQAELSALRTVGGGAQRQRAAFEVNQRWTDVIDTLAVRREIDEHAAGGSA